MKLRPTPTSPKVRDKEKLIREISAPDKKFDQPKRSKNGLAVFIIAILLGFLAGFLGEITVSSLAVKYPDFWLFSSIYLRTHSSSTELIIRKETKDLTAQELADDSLIANAAPQVVGIFKKKDQSPEDPLSGVYLDQERLGNGVLVTNDGLIMTTTNVVSSDENEYLVISAEGTQYQPENIIIDRISHTAFFWIDFQSDKIADFELDHQIPQAASLYTLYNSIRREVKVAVRRIEQLSYLPQENASDLLESSEEFSRLIALSSPVTSAYEGAPVIGVGGKIIGLIYSLNYPDEANTVLPHQYATDRLAELLADKKIDRASLGIKYLDLARTTGLSKNLTAGKTKGILIQGLPTGHVSGPKENSVLAQLKIGDIILSLNNQELDRDTYFTQEVQLLKPKEEITLKILRADIEKTVTVELIPL